MCQELSHYVGGMHIFSSPFQDCVTMKPISRIVSHVSSLCKNETILILSLLIKHFINLFFLDEAWFSHSIITIFFIDHMLSLVFLPFPEEPLS